jgi:ribosomal protein L37AE/L43A
MTYADVKIRREYANMLRALAMRVNVKIADVVGLWPMCPKCMSPLVQTVEEGVVTCPNCRREFIVVEL